jgi:type II secretion system protein I
VNLGSVKGFTFIEVLVAMLIFTLAVLAALNIVTGSVRAVKEAKEISQASWLLQNLMAEAESKLEGQGIDKACLAKEDGKFPEPYQNFRWKKSCYRIDFKLSEGAARLQEQMQSGNKEEESDKENQMLKMVLNLASEYITRSTRELHAEVIWMQGKTQRQISATSHFVRYDQQPALPGAPSPATAPVVTE